MALSKAIPIRNASPAPLDGRLADMAQYVCNSDGSPRVGVLGAANLSIVSALGTMNVAVAAAEFLTSKGKADGVSAFTNDGVVNVPIAAAPGSNSRITVIWVKQEDDTTGDTASLPIFGTTNGTAAASPTKPAIPTGCLELATLRVYAGTVAANGGANTLVNTYQMTASRGGVVPFRTKVDMDLWTNPVDGQLAMNLATGELYTRKGGAWTIGLKVASGTVTLTNTTGGGVSPVFWSDLFPVVFPVGLFSAPPQVTVSTTGPGGQVPFGGQVEAVTAAGCSVRGFRIAAVPGATFFVDWIAVGV